MIRKPNFKLNWKYALGEILLIFIGISLAIGFQNWNEGRKASKKETQLLQQLKSEVTLLIDEAHIDIDFTRNVLALTDSILDYDPNVYQRPFQEFFSPQKVGRFFMLNSQLFPSTTAYENWKALGFELIKDDSLRIFLGDLYDRRLTRVTEWENELYGHERKIRYIMEERFVENPSAKQGGYPALMPKSLEAFRNDTHLIHSLHNYQRFRNVQIGRYQNVIEVATKVLARIDQNLME